MLVRTSICQNGLKCLGKGNWRGISKYFVTIKTTQVASHFQKHFIRQKTPS
ncbi:MYB-like transcription factor family protein [Medicago truncatula]|uniref:MYB-like transcription factor family protein n=1 Tax=Medicago truncatula TaxID=3880 RepID=G7KTQ5_MEDTR|nr:MYB-like transcription factor family protein [Medicago truncatula]